MMASKADDIEYLEYLYSPSRWVIRKFPDGNDVLTNFVKNGLLVREKLVEQFECELNVEYGNGKKTKMDIFYPTKSTIQNRDVLIFIHGGYWQEGSKDIYPYLGSHLNDLNCTLVMVGYDLAPDESMDGIVEQIKSAILFTAKKFPSSRLFLVGHSAGAHLAAMMMMVNWEESGLSPHRFTGVCLLSGIYDLEPLLSTYVNNPIKMDKEIAARNSPIKIIQSCDVTIQCRVLFVVAEHDSSAFHKQSKDFYEVLKEKLRHHHVEYIDIPGVDHFDLVEKCTEKDFILNKELANFIKNDNKSCL